MQQKYRGKTTTVKLATKHIGNWRMVFPTNCVKVALRHNHVTMYYTKISLTFCRDPLQLVKSREEKDRSKQNKTYCNISLPHPQHPYVLDSSSLKGWRNRRVMYILYLIYLLLALMHVYLFSGLALGVLLM